MHDEHAIYETLQAAMKAEAERRQRAIQLWGPEGDGGRERMPVLCSRFPSLRTAPGTDPWNAEVLLKWLCTSGAVTSGSEMAGRFALQVYNSTLDWAACAREQGWPAERATPFNVVEAFGCWDQEHREAFLVWAQYPFFP